MTLQLSPISPVAGVSQQGGGVDAAAHGGARPKATAAAGESREMPSNAAAAQLSQARASTQTQHTGAMSSVKVIGAQIAAELQVDRPTIIESIKEQQGGGRPGGTVTELTSMIEGASAMARPTDLERTRLDAKDTVSQLRKITDQTIAAGEAEQAENAKIDPVQRMKDQLAEANSHQGAYSTVSLVAVSHEAQARKSFHLSL